LLTIWGRLRDAGIRVVAGTITPLGSTHALFSAATTQTTLDVNDWIRRTATSISGVILWDAHAAIVDATQSDGRADSTKLKSDAIHPNAKGARALGESLYATLASQIVPQNTLVSSQSDSYGVNAASTQLLDNPLFIGSGGTAGTGVTGTVAANWNPSRAAGSGAAIAATVEARTVADDGDTLGSNQVLTITTAAANDVVQIRNASSVHGRVSAGDVVYAEAHVQISGMTNVSFGKFLILATGLHYSEYMLDNTGFDNTAIDGVWRTPNFVVPASTTSLYVYFSVKFSGAGGAVMKIGRAQLRKVT
jgi:hypothetical protein